MATVSHEPARVAQEKRPWASQLAIREMWASLTIIVMWLAVLFDAVYGSNIVSTTPGGDSTSVPSAVAVAVFAFLGTWVVARYGFRSERKSD